MMTKEYGIEFYVYSVDEFNDKYPVGTHARADIENTFITEYKHTYCGYEYPNPLCGKLESMGIYAE